MTLVRNLRLIVWCLPLTVFVAIVGGCSHQGAAPEGPTTPRKTTPPPEGLVCGVPIGSVAEPLSGDVLAGAMTLEVVYKFGQKNGGACNAVWLHSDVGAFVLDDGPMSMRSESWEGGQLRSIRVLAADGTLTTLSRESPGDYCVSDVSPCPAPFATGMCCRLELSGTRAESARRNRSIALMNALVMYATPHFYSVPQRRSAESWIFDGGTLSLANGQPSAWEPSDPEPSGPHMGIRRVCYDRNAEIAWQPADAQGSRVNSYPQHLRVESVAETVRRVSSIDHIDVVRFRLNGPAVGLELDAPSLAASECSATD